jgi:hypothetical protein
MRTISTSAKFRIESGVLQPVELHVQEVKDEEYERYLDSFFRKGLSNAREVLEKRIPKPIGVHNPILGPLGLFYGDSNRGLAHIMANRTEAHQRDPNNCPPAEEELEHLIRAAVYGQIARDMPNSPRDKVRIHLVLDGHQVVLAPIWQNARNAPNPLPVDKNPAWILTGYRMEIMRKTAMPEWLANPASALEYRRTYAQKR